MPPDDVPFEARRWLEQAAEDLMAAQRLADDPEMPPRLAAFLAHLAAEKALKGALLARGIPIRRIHDLVELQSTLIPADVAVISPEDIDVLLPWNIAGRYPADMGDADVETATLTVQAASRIVDELTRRIRNGH
ncbi:MAG: HEPN domain-containing protein [Pseudonocardiales bacterium]